MPKSEKEHNSVIYMYLQILSKSKSGHIHLGLSLHAKYHDPRSSGCPDILFTRFHRLIMQKSKKGHKYGSAFFMLVLYNI